MNLFLDFLLPVDESIKHYAENQTLESLGKKISFLHDIPQAIVESASVVIIGIPEDRTALNNEGAGLNNNEVRKEFYQLYYGNWKTKIYDCGDLKVGDTFNDTLVIVQELTAYFVKNQIYPIFLGGSQALTYALYRAYDLLEQRVNLTTVDAKFDLGSLGESLNSGSYLTKIIMDKPNNLDNYTNLGFQTFLNSQEEIHLMDGLLFDVYRLGNLKSNMELCEPVLRETDVLSIDLSAIKSIDAPANNNKIISGLSSDEICQICRYAGISDKLNVLGIFEYNSKYDINNQTAQLIAQMIWYYVEGVNLRKPEFPNLELKDFKKYMVVIDDETYHFYKSDVTNRWWMEINAVNDNIITRKTLIPCTYNDFLTANNLEIPERWFVNRRKLG
jgi:arginase family enzyme